VGLIDFIRRRRLTQQGLSSGKKRRTQTDGLVASTLDRSVVLRISIYGAFAAVMGLLVMGAGRQDGPALEAGQGILVSLLVLIMVVMVFEMSHRGVARRNGQVLLVFGGLALHLALIPAVAVFVDGNGFHEALKLLLIPFALAPIIHSVLLGMNVGLFSVVCTSLFGCFLVPEQSMLNYMVTSVLAGLTAVYVTREVRKRGRLLRAGFYVGAVVLVVAYAFDTISIGPLFGGGVSAWELFGVNSVAAFGTGLVTGMLVSGLLPVLEGTFALTTDISWLELSDLNHRLLRRMQLEAPGTFHHSLVVASLSEAAAESIGVNPMVCRVCSYFHDIGKLNKPEYFIENQGDTNPHDSLTPTMSSLIIVAHVKDGVDLALKHKLNPRIIDVICEHHGDSLVYFFYRKAQEQRKLEEEKVKEGLENPEDLPVIDEKNFRYPGPRPRSKESGIISLADAVESASRSLRKPTPQKIRAMIDDIVFNRIKDGQLDDCGLTVNELRCLRESFSGTLRSMLHSRIEYPKQGQKTESKAGDGGPPTEHPGKDRKTEKPAVEEAGEKRAGNVVPVEELEKHRRKAAGDTR
jgi:putative nucleotidyltransferase with HDIG domain